jgi:hypothetical protein
MDRDRYVSETQSIDNTVNSMSSSRVQRGMNTLFMMKIELESIALIRVTSILGSKKQRDRQAHVRLHAGSSETTLRVLFDRMCKNKTKETIIPS